MLNFTEMSIFKSILNSVKHLFNNTDEDEAFQKLLNKVSEAAKDGVITPSEIRDIHFVLQDLNLSEKKLHQVKMKVINHLLDKVVKINVITYDEIQLLEAIKNSLQLSNKEEVGRSIKERTTNIPKFKGEVIKQKQIETNTTFYSIEEALKQPEKANALILYKRELTELSSEIGKLTKLQSLNLSKNEITELPPEIGNLKELRKLNIENNQLKKLPLEIGNLEKLEELYLAHNKLNTIPKEIGKLKKLQLLNLANNELQIFPDEVASLDNLKFLFVMENDLKGKEKISQNLPNTKIKF